MSSLFYCISSALEYKSELFGYWQIEDLQKILHSEKSKHIITKSHCKQLELENDQLRGEVVSAKREAQESKQYAHCTLHSARHLSNANTIVLFNHPLQ